MRDKMRSEKKPKEQKSNVRKAAMKGLALLGTAAIITTASCAGGQERCSEARQPDPSTQAQVERRESSGATLLIEHFQESQVVLEPNQDLTSLRAEVVVFEPAQRTSGTDVRAVMEEIVERCRSSGDLQGCIMAEAHRPIVSDITRIQNPILEFEYYDASQRAWVPLTDRTRGNECDISNLAPGMVRVLFFPSEDQNIMSSMATMHLN